MTVVTRGTLLVGTHSECGTRVDLLERKDTATMTADSSTRTAPAAVVDSPGAWSKDTAKTVDSSLLGGEEPLFDTEEEEQGVQDVLDGLTEEEREQIPEPTMAIRHFRAEKVRKRERERREENLS
jgi:hypothetical protein